MIEASGYANRQSDNHLSCDHGTYASPPFRININGYLIRSLKQTDSLCHVYYASDVNHVQYLLREFCPQGLAVRDPESGKLRYPENTDIEREVLPLKNDFEAQFRTGSLGEIPALGTLYLAYALPGVHPAAGSPRLATPVEPLQRDQKPWPLPQRAPPVHAVPLSSPGKRKARRHLDPYPDSAGRRLRRLLLHAEACGGLRRPAEPSVRKKKRRRAPKPRKPPCRRKWKTPLTGVLPRRPPGEHWNSRKNAVRQCP
ncbi:MAG: hypothetical protein ACLT8E_02930 [Akkermansia sp.]